MAPSLETRSKNHRTLVPSRRLPALFVVVAVLGAAHVALAQPGEGAGATINRGAGMSTIRNLTTTELSLRPRAGAWTRADRSAQCANCEGELLELAVQLVDAEGNAVTLSDNQVVVVSYHTTDGTAKAGEDYRAIADASLTITGNVQPLIQVQTFEDTLNEADETFTVTLLPADLPDGGRTDRLDPRLTIFDDDGLAAMLSANTSTLEEGAAATFAVELTGGTSTAPVVIGYEVDAGSTVTAGEDYTEPEGIFTIAPGRVRGTFSHRNAR